MWIAIAEGSVSEGLKLSSPDLLPVRIVQKSLKVTDHGLVLPFCDGAFEI